MRTESSDYPEPMVDPTTNRPEPSAEGSSNDHVSVSCPPPEAILSLFMVRGKGSLWVPPLPSLPPPSHLPSAVRIHFLLCSSSFRPIHRTARSLSCGTADLFIAE